MSACKHAAQDLVKEYGKTHDWAQEGNGGLSLFSDVPEANDASQSTDDLQDIALRSVAVPTTTSPAVHGSPSRALKPVVGSPT